MTTDKSEPVQGGERMAAGLEDVEHTSSLIESATGIAFPSLAPEEGLFGRDGWVFLGNKYVLERDQALGQHKASDEHIERLAHWVSGMAEYAQSHGVPFLFAVAPAKWSIYEDKVPLKGKRSPSIFDRLLSALGPQPYVLDLRPALIEARSVADTYSPLNSHWTDFGAWVAWRAISERLSSLLPGHNFLHSDENPRVVSVDSLNECAQLMGIEGPNPWTVAEFSTPFPDFEMMGQDFARSMQNGTRQVDLLEMPAQTMTRNASSPCRALIIRDSTGTQLSPFLTSGFAKTWQVFHNFGQFRGPAIPADLAMRTNLVGRLDQYQPDLVLFVITERYLALPVDASAYWSAMADFDAASTSKCWAWPKQPDATFLPFDDDVALSRPTLIDLSDLLSGGKDLLLRLRVTAGETGGICFGYTTPLGAQSVWFWIEPGVNDIYHRIPSDIAAGHFWIARHEDAALLVMTQLTLRAAL